MKWRFCWVSPFYRCVYRQTTKYRTTQLVLHIYPNCLNCPIYPTRCGQTKLKEHKNTSKSVCDYVFSFSFGLSIKHRYRRIHQTDSLSLRQFLMDLKFHSVFLLTEKYGNSYIAKPVHKACLSINLIKTCEKAALSGSAAPEFKLTQVTFFIHIAREGALGQN